MTGWKGEREHHNARIIPDVDDDDCDGKERRANNNACHSIAFK
jgi:hypothetical protein